MKNKTLCLLLSALLVTFLFGCGGGSGNSNSGEVTAVTSANATPVADAGTSQTVQEGSLAALDGTGSSDPDGDGITFAWTMTKKPEGSIATISDTDGST